MRDLQSPRFMLLKAALFVAIGGVAAALIILEAPTPGVALKVAALLGLAIWAFARAYYFCFYVITHYIDPTYKYAGLFHAVRHAVWHKRG